MTGYALAPAGMTADDLELVTEKEVDHPSEALGWTARLTRDSTAGMLGYDNWRIVSGDKDLVFLRTVVATDNVTNRSSIELRDAIDVAAIFLLADY